MTIAVISQIDLREFKVWGNGLENLNKLKMQNLTDEFENFVCDVYPDGCTDTELNNLLEYEIQNFVDNYLRGDYGTI